MKYFKNKQEDYNNVLHIWDVAGIPCIFSKFLKKLDYKSDLIMRASHDLFGFVSYYNETLLDVSGYEFLKYAIKKSEKYGIIHVNNLFKLVPDLKKKYPDKKIILHYHGLQLTRNFNDTFRKKCDKQADLVLVSTPNLAKLSTYLKYIPNPIDTELFKPLGKKRNQKALLMLIRYLDIDLIRKHIKKNKIFYEIEERDREKIIIPNYKMVDLLNEYSYFLDIKYVDGKLLEAHSKTALEALACGTCVIDYKNAILTELPSEHRAENSTKKLSKLYQEIIK